MYSLGFPGAIWRPFGAYQKEGTSSKVGAYVLFSVMYFIIFVDNCRIMVDVMSYLSLLIGVRGRTHTVTNVSSWHPDESASGPVFGRHLGSQSEGNEMELLEEISPRGLKAYVTLHLKKGLDHLGRGKIHGQPLSL